MIEQDVTETKEIADELASALTAQYGSMLGSAALIKELGYTSAAAFHQSLSRGTLPIPVFKIQHRRGSFALARDVAVWLSSQRANAIRSK